MPNKYDLHTHFFSNWEEGKYSLERVPRDPWYVLDAIKRKKLEGVVLSNYGEKGIWGIAFEEFVESAKDKGKLKKWQLVKKLTNCLIFENGDCSIKVIKGQEVPTERGHVMAIALDSHCIVPSRLGLRQTLIEIKNRRGIASADHYNGFAGIGEENLAMYMEEGLFYTWERFNANYSIFPLNIFMGTNPSKEEADNLEKSMGVKGISVSDCHNRRDVGNGYIEMDLDLDFSNEDSLRESLKETLEKGKFVSIIERKNPLSSMLGHMVIDRYDYCVRQNLGLIKDCENY